MLVLADQRAAVDVEYLFTIYQNPQCGRMLPSQNFRAKEGEVQIDYWIDVVKNVEKVQKGDLEEPTRLLKPLQCDE